jgi:hypothetical protein
MVSAPVAGLATFALGLPIYRYLLRRSALSVTSSMAAGALIALLLCMLLLAANRVTGFLDSDIGLAIASIVAAGPVSGFALWLVVRWLTRSKR